MTSFITKSVLLSAAALFLLLPVFPAEDKMTSETPEPTPWRVGTELDVLPYATGGYYGSFVVGRKEWRVRAVAARSTAPSFLVSNGFQDKRTDAYAGLVDRFLGSRRAEGRGFWIGGGMEYWRNRIRQDGSSEYTHYNNTMLTAGGGYLWKLSRHIYLNPWSGAHLVVGGDRKINVSGKMYKQPFFTPELSVKISFTF